MPGKAAKERGKGIAETEWDLLEVLWARETATAREVADALQETRGWAYSTVKTMLDRLVDKKLVVARKVGSVWEYRAGLERSEARRGAWRRFVDTVFGGSMAPALEFLATDVDLSEGQREKLARLLEPESEDERE